VDIQQSIGALGEVLTTLVLFAIGVAILEGILYLVLVRWLRWRLALPILLIAPGMLGLLALVIYPLLWEVNVGFTNMSINRFCDPGIPAGLFATCREQPMFNGIENYINVFTRPVLQVAGFWQILWQTVLWTAINVSFHVGLGLGLALLLHRRLRFKGTYRAFIILPWAVPQIVALAVWRTELNAEFGMVNQLLAVIGIDGPSWMTEPFWNFFAMVMVNVWLGVPFMMVILLGGLQSIPDDLYEAADIDGASSRQSFRHITLPLLRPVMVPAVILGVVWTFNNFNVPFIINQLELETSDTLVTALFRAAFQYNRYGFAGAFAVVIFAILLVFVIVYVRRSGALRGAYE
jgi:arabinogalactan oligomer/maltooligosaccharide transport system permease protein